MPVDFVTALSKLCCNRSDAQPSPREPTAQRQDPAAATSDSIELTSNRGVAPKMSASAIEKNAHAVWLHKAGDTGDLPSAYKQTALTFARLNKDWQTTLWTDDPKRLAARFGEHTPSNLRIKSIDPLVDTYRTRYPFVADYIHGVKRYIPASAKDLTSYMALDREPGLFFDLDTKWSKPVPSPLHVRVAVIPGFGLENNLILFNKNAHPDFMHKTLAAGEQFLSKTFDREVSPAGKMTLKVRDGSSLAAKDVVNQAGYFAFQNKAMYEIMKRDERPTVQSMLDCTSPDTSKRWVSQSMGLNRLPVPSRSDG